MHGWTQEMENQLTSKWRESYVVPPTQENCWGEGCVHVTCELLWQMLWGAPEWASYIGMNIGYCMLPWQRQKDERVELWYILFKPHHIPLTIQRSRLLDEKQLTKSETTQLLSVTVFSTAHYKKVAIGQSHVWIIPWCKLHRGIT